MITFCQTLILFFVSFGSCSSDEGGFNFNLPSTSNYDGGGVIFGLYMAAFGPQSHGYASFPLNNMNCDHSSSKTRRKFKR